MFVPPHIAPTHQATLADCRQNKRAAVLSLRGTNIDMLQWPAMLIKYMLIEIQWQLEFHSKLGGGEGRRGGDLGSPQECKT